MKNCDKCNAPLYRNAKYSTCMPCRGVCDCGQPKDYRADHCKQCDGERSRQSAKTQWQRLRPKMVESLIKSAAIRKGKHIKPKRPCSVDGCNEPREARGWCHKHYAHWKFAGYPVAIRLTPEERFWANIKKTDGCWLWAGPVNENGYGIIRIDGKPVRAHRYSYFLEYGEYPMPMGRHTCDNPPCVRPDHIVPGTQTQNVEDRVQRNRQPRGSQVGGSKLTEADVIEIKRLLKEKIFQRDIGAMFGVNTTTICNIKCGRTWKHIE